MKPSLPIPAAALQHHMIALGKTRAGKSSKLRVLVEALLEQRMPVTIVDPKGDWWGLKSSADGKHAGYPVVIFGGEHADVPINEHSGAHVAELVATGNRPALIDLGGWMVAERTRFFIAFASTFFKLTRGARYLVIDEVHNFAPQSGARRLDPESAKCLHWANRLASEGSGKGVTMIAASQRPQKVHKDFVTSCETLIACKVIHKLDRDAIKDWIDGCADAAKGRQVIADLAQLKKPEAWVWCPEIDFGPERVTFPLYRTYDSFKPQPAGGAQLKGWADVDLEEVKAKLAQVVAEAEANDPAFLKKRIRELERQVKHSSRAGNGDLSPGYGPGKADTAELRELRKRNQVLERDNAALRDHADKLFATAAVVQATLDEASESADIVRAKLREALGVRMPKQPRLSAASVTSATFNAEALNEKEIATLQQQAPPGRIERLPPPPRLNGSGRPAGLAKAEFAILRALWWLRHEDTTPAKVSFYADYSAKSSSFANALGSLRTAGLVAGWRITEAGESALVGYVEEKPAGTELREWLRPKLGKAENAILDALVGAGGSRLSDEQISELAGYSLTSSSFANALGALRSVGAAEGYARDGGTRAAKVFFS